MDHRPPSTIPPSPRTGGAGRWAAFSFLGLLCGCANPAGWSLAYPVAHPMVGPAYPLISWDTHRHLAVRVSDGGGYRYRYVDDTRGIATALHGARIAMQFETQGRDGRTHRGTQFALDNGERIALLDVWTSAAFCDTGKQVDGQGRLADGECTLALMWLSLDAGASFHARRVLLPTRRWVDSASAFAFLMVRGHTAYLGMREAKSKECQLGCWYDGQSGVAHRDRPGGSALSRVYGKNDHVFVFSIDLSQAVDQQAAAFGPRKGTDPRCGFEDSQPQDDGPLGLLTARRVEGAALEALAIPAVEDAPLPRPQVDLHPPPHASYEEAVRRRFVASLRATHAGWAAVQKVDIGPLRYETHEERRRREEKEATGKAAAAACPDPFWYPGGGAHLPPAHLTPSTPPAPAPR